MKKNVKMQKEAKKNAKIAKDLRKVTCLRTKDTLRQWERPTRCMFDHIYC